MAVSERPTMLIPCAVVQYPTGRLLPVSVAIPFAEHCVADFRRLTISNSWSVPGTLSLVAQWPDGSVQWVRYQFLPPESLANGTTFNLSAHTRYESADEAATLPPSLFPIGGEHYCVGSKGLFTADSAVGSDIQAIDIVIEPRSGTPQRCKTGHFTIVRSDKTSTVISIEGRFPRGNPCRFVAQAESYPAIGLVRLDVTLTNPRRARHSGGYWDLGDPGSFLLKDVSVVVRLNEKDAYDIAWQADALSAPHSNSTNQLVIYQGSSGGVHWQSDNHVNRLLHNPVVQDGYTVKAPGVSEHGHRAAPIVRLSHGQSNIAFAIEEFWQKFPTAIEVNGNEVLLRLLPKQFGDLHELQAGERFSKTVWLQVSDPTQAESQHSLDWLASPPHVVVNRDYLRECGCISYFSETTCDRVELTAIVDDALQGPRSFFAKREQVDEYSWRHFGDMWADHEGEYSDDPAPVYSHYNNQYDLLHSLLIYYLRSGDIRWWQLADPLARHICDIDLYHTTRDKPGYNGGAFWHTAHYHSVATATHRSMSRRMRGKRIPAPGTGPGNEHSYSSGLLLYYFLTGSNSAHDAVLSIADWIVAMDEGPRHLLGAISTAPTGDATRTTESSFHGPGRGAGNSINSLLNAWSLSHDRKYLAKLEELVYRTIHSSDAIDALNLRNAELRWSYTVYLQVLDKVLCLLPNVAEWASVRSHIRESLVHYARWMVKIERIYLHSPEELEFPTETWAAQELRKGVVLLMIAEYANDDERELFRGKGREILDAAWPLFMSYSTRDFTRPLAVALQQGYLETALNQGAHAKRKAFVSQETGQPKVHFFTQKEHVKSALKSPRKWPALALRACQPRGWANIVQQTWAYERVVRLFE